MCSRFMFLILFLLTLSTVLDAQTTPATGQGVLSPDKFPSKVEELLDIQDHQSNILPALELALTKRNSPPAEYAEAINALVDALLKGPSSDVLLEQKLPQVEIGSDASTATRKASWKWASVSERLALVSKMGQLAAQMRQADPKRASEIGRSALLLAALDDFGHQWSGVLVINDPASKRDKNMEKLLDLPEGHYAALEKLIADRQAAYDRYESLKFSATQLVDKLAASKGDVKIEEVRLALAKLDEAYKDASIQYGYQSEIIEIAWKLLNLVRARDSHDGILAVSEQLKAWDTSSEASHPKRWISQALTRVGPAPRPMIVVEFVGADGNTVKKMGLEEMAATQAAHSTEPKK